MSQRDDKSTLADVMRAASLISEFAAQSDAEEFETNALVQSAVLHQFLVLGEATKRLSAAFREEHAGLPWRQMARMRDRLIHGYDDVDVEIVWRTATEEVPKLLAKLRALG